MTKSHRIFNKPELKEFRKALREKSTSAEVALWNLLKNKQLDGRKFRRQYSLGNYIADFCCTSEKLIIELDGQVHGDYLQIERDIKRDQYIENLGFVILRFENKLVFEVPEFVISEIQKSFKKEGDSSTVEINQPPRREIGI
jgi:very-short-patch-repair endonuclease